MATVPASWSGPRELRWIGIGNVPEGWPGSVVTIGVFDGFHRGHLELVRRAQRAADRRGVPLALVTFDPHPRSVLRPATAPSLLLTVPQRVQMAHALGVDVVVVVEFSPEFAAIPAEVFIEEALIRTLGVREVVVGSDHRFGARSRGDVAMLRAAGRRAGFVVDAVENFAVDGVVCSSTELRRCLASGDSAGAAAVLGRTHLLDVPGTQLTGAVAVDL